MFFAVWLSNICDDTLWIMLCENCIDGGVLVNDNLCDLKFTIHMI